ncbi:MAG TPA: hypothetical protein VF048_12320, partial [Gemmatimonadaceae bacterium]
ESAAGAAVDSMKAAIQRMIADSVAHALRQAERVVTRIGVPEGGWRSVSPEELQRLSELGTRMAERGARGAEVPRVMVAPDPAAASRRRVLLGEVQNLTGRRELRGVTSAIGRALRERLAEGEVYDVRRAPSSTAGTGTAGSGFAAQVGAGALLTPMLIARGDSLLLQVVVVEPRRRRVLATVEGTAPMRSPMDAVTAVVEPLRTTLARMDWPVSQPVPRAVPAAPAPPAPVPPPVPPPSE